MDRNLFEKLFNDPDLKMGTDVEKLKETINEFDSNKTVSGSETMIGGKWYEGKLPKDPSEVQTDATTGPMLEQDVAGVVPGAKNGDVTAIKKAKAHVKEDLQANPNAPASSLKVIARGLSDEMSAKSLAQSKQGEVVSDDMDPKKFMVVIKGDTNETVDEGGSLSITFSDLTPQAQQEVLEYFEQTEMAPEVVIAIANPEGMEEQEVTLTDGEPTNYESKVDEAGGGAMGGAVAGPGGGGKTIKTGKIASADSIVGKTKANVKEGKLKEERDPLAANITALKSTIINLNNFFAAGDLNQAVEYANLATKQAADVGANLTTMKASQEAANNVANPQASAGAVVPPAMPAAPAVSTEEAPVPVEEPLPGEDKADEETYVDESKKVKEASMPIGLKSDVAVGEKTCPKCGSVLKAGKCTCVKEGKVPADPNHQGSNAEQQGVLLEKRITELAEKLYLVTKLKEKKELTKKEKKFIEAVEAEKLDETTRNSVKEAYKKLISKETK